MNRLPAFIAAISLFFSGCTNSAKPQDDPVKSALASPMSQLKYYDFDPGKPLAERIGPAPAFLRDAMASADRAPDYESYTPTAEELAMLLGQIERLPAGMRAAFEERLIGIYFIKNFMGNGLTTWVVDEKNTMFAAMVINPAALSRSLSETLTLRERSLFSGGQDIRIDCGTKHRGLVYVLLHEGAHVFDYVRGITPYVEEVIVKAFREGRGLDASWDVWAGYSTPQEGADFPYRKKLGFYGLDGAPVIKGSEAPALYAQLRGSPFPSLYGSRTWAEDAAELAVFYHVTRILKQPYVIEWPENGARARYNPMESARVLERAEKVYSLLK
ncbi:MAG: hypothetical protein ABII00_08630 [Elusimicrobiota bacterium]